MPVRTIGDPVGAVAETRDTIGVGETALAGAKVGFGVAMTKRVGVGVVIAGVAVAESSSLGVVGLL